MNLSKILALQIKNTSKKVHYALKKKTYYDLLL